MDFIKNKQLQIKITEQEQDMIQNIRKEGINISGLVRKLLKEYYDYEILDKREDNYP